MSRPFRLAGLLRLRTMAEERAAVELARTTRERDAAEVRRRATQASLGDAQLGERSDLIGVRAVIASRMALSNLLVDHAAQVVVAQDSVDTADAEWSAARTRTRTLEKLQERQEKAALLEEQRGEQKVLDEIAGRRPAVLVPGPGEDS
ncbi:MAG TPA: flagellar FliJ family protein [Cellulomonas sp.]